LGTAGQVTGNVTIIKMKLNVVVHDIMILERFSSSYLSCRFGRLQDQSESLRSPRSALARLDSTHWLSVAGPATEAGSLLALKPILV
jgi:hypothetical protein